MTHPRDLQFMQLALAQAQRAGAAGEVPVGAVVVRDGQVLGVGHNAPISTHDPSAHAEVMALRAAAHQIGNYRLSECELFVTLEPCAMCAGALINARIKRVVFGASDAKAGAGGSVLNLFEHRQINHQTKVQGGFLAETCAALLADFFKSRRIENANRAKANWPLRDDALRTPEAAFSQLSEWPAGHFVSRFVADLPTLAGLRQHYLDEGPPSARRGFVCLHSPGTWGYAFHGFIKQAMDQGERIVVPDMIGFGKSDKPKKPAFHTTEWHRENLIELLDRLGMEQVTWVVQGDSPWGFESCSALAKRMASKGEMMHLAIEPWVSHPGHPAWLAPFPDSGYRAGPKAFGCIEK